MSNAGSNAAVIHQQLQFRYFESSTLLSKILHNLHLFFISHRTIPTHLVQRVISQPNRIHQLALISSELNSHFFHYIILSSFLLIIFRHTIFDFAYCNLIISTLFFEVPTWFQFQSRSTRVRAFFRFIHQNAPTQGFLFHAGGLVLYSHNFFSSSILSWDKQFAK